MAPTDSTRFLRWYGREGPPLPLQVLTAGPLSVLVEGVDVRRVTYAGIPVMDRVFVAIRDVDWGTLPAIVDAPSEMAMDPASGATVLTFHARHADATIRFEWHGRIRVGPGAVVSLEMDGVAEAAFQYARMGICALLPARSMAGRPVRSSRAGDALEGTLPDLIAPQLIVDGSDVPIVPAFRELEVSLPHVVVHQRFEGDDFELEDQRNWTDDSFKAYSLMSGEAYPRSARQGQRFWQRVTVTVSDRTGAPASGAATGEVEDRSHVAPLPDTVVVSLTDDRLLWPAFGLGDTADGSPLTTSEARALGALGIDHIRAEIQPGRDGWQDALRRVAGDAAAIGASLELALSLDEAALDELPHVAAALAGTPVDRVLVLHAPTQTTASTPAGWLGRARAVLGDSVPCARWIVGTDGDFAEINRDRPSRQASDPADGVCYALDPQIHASDEMSMAETLPAQGQTVVTAASWYPDGDICVSPVTLRQRFNPAALAGGANDPASALLPTGPDPVTASLPLGVDHRQRSLFGAAWTLGSIASLTGVGATSVTWYETVGWRGLLERAQPPARPGWGPVTPGEVYPLYRVFRDLADRRSMVPVRCRVSADRDVVALGMRAGRGVRLMVANLTARQIGARIEGLPEGAAESWTLDASTPSGTLEGMLDARARQHPVVNAGTTTIELPPFATVRLDVVSRA